MLSDSLGERYIILQTATKNNQSYAKSDLDTERNCRKAKHSKLQLIYIEALVVAF